jgi:ketosteroid isomerase-like protein
MINLSVNFSGAKLKNIILILGLLLTLSTVILGQQTGGKSKNNKAEQEVLKINEDFDRAIMAQDAAGYRRILADSFIFTSASGKVTNKSQELAKVISGDFKYELVKSDDLGVEIYGKTAVLTGRFKAKGKYKGNSFEFSERYTAVFVKRNGRWQMVAEHASEIVQK